MKIYDTQIRRIMPNAPSSRISEFVASFNKWCSTFGISSPWRASHYIAQVAHETGELRYMEELSSGAQYEGRKDLGNIHPGDGVRYKGRGYLQTTGRSNYQRYASSKYCNGDLMSHPEWLSRSPGNQKSSMFFWMVNGLNELSDFDDVKSVTKRVNGGYNGLESRMYYTRRAKSVFNIKREEAKKQV